MKRITLAVALTSLLAACAHNEENLQASAQPQGQVQRLIANEAKNQGVPVSLALKVARVESRFRCDAVGPHTKQGRAQGPLQIMPRSARGLGHSGGPLNNCGAGLHYGMKHLAMCVRKAGGNQALAAKCHLTGPGGLNNQSAYARKYVHMVMNEK